MSPIVAAIILVLVTLAVSIVIVAWLVALAFTFMYREQFAVTDIQFLDDGTKVIRITIENNGTYSVTINEIQISFMTQHLIDPELPVAIDAQDELIVDVTFEWIEYTTYNIEAISARGNRLDSIATAPG